MIEVELTGGTANPGGIVRIGETVRRPRHPASEVVQSFLGHLHASGVGKVPQPMGFDESGREVVSYIPGQVAHPPFGSDGSLPEWATRDELMIEVAELQAQIHQAADNFMPPPDVEWATTGGGYFPASAAGNLVCHNDICVSNVVVEDGRVAGIIDFDYLKPVDRLFDIAVAARHWVPLIPPGDRPQGWQDADEASRFSTFCQIHGLSREERRRTVELATEFLSNARTNVRRLADAGHPGFSALMARGYAEYNKRSVSWLLQNGTRIAT
jgi:hypothetical protein